MNTQTFYLINIKEQLITLVTATDLKVGVSNFGPPLQRGLTFRPDERLALETLEKQLLSIVKTNAYVTEKLKIAMTILYLSFAELR